MYCTIDCGLMSDCKAASMLGFFCCFLFCRVPYISCACQSKMGFTGLRKVILDYHLSSRKEACGFDTRVWLQKMGVWSEKTDTDFFREIIQNLRQCASYVSKKYCVILFFKSKIFLGSMTNLLIITVVSGTTRKLSKLSQLYIILSAYYF